MKHRLKILNRAPNQENPLANSVISTKTPSDTISDSKFGGGGVYCANLSLLAACGPVPN